MSVVRLDTHGQHGPPLYGLWLLIGAVWGLVAVALLTQHAYLIDHHQLMGGHTMRMAGHTMRMGGLHLPWLVALVLFLAAWQVMTAAMMLPSSLPMVTLFAQASKRQGHPRAALILFVAGYATIWTAFALAAFLSDMLVAGVQDAWPWLADRPWVVGASTLAVAGEYEFSAVKARWLHACRSPVQMRWRDALGAGSAWRCGLRHGAHCVGSCGALMWIMFGTELAVVPVMVVLTAVMLAEKTLRRGPQLSPVVGSVLLLLAAVGLVHPAGFSLSL